MGDYSICIIIQKPIYRIYRTYSDRQCGVSSGSILFATHPAILDTTSCSVVQNLEQAW